MAHSVEKMDFGQAFPGELFRDMITLHPDPTVAAHSIERMDFGQAVPGEILDIITLHLDKADLLNLRAVSTALYRKVTTSVGYLRCVVAYQKADLSDKSLDQLLEVLRDPYWGPHVHTITLTALYYDLECWCELLTSEEKSGWRIASVNIKKMTLKRSGRKWFFKEPNTDELAKRLTLIFDHIHHPITLHLKTREISGQGEAVNGLGRRWYNNRNEHILSWNRIWLLCTRVLTAATSAMVLSKSRFEGLSVFNRCFGKVQSRDFVPLTKILTERGFATSVGASLKHLTLGFSTWIYLSEHYNPESVSGFQSNDKLRLDSYDSSNYEGVINFVRLFPNVESLDFVMYKTPRPPPKARTSYFRNLNPFEAVLKRQVSRPAVLFPRLKRLTVRGVELDHTDFMFFLHSHPTIEYLDMRNITARLELWSVVFHYIHNMQNLKEPVHLEGLDSYSGVVNLQPVDPAFQTPPSQVPEGTFFLDEWESEFSLDSAYVHTRDISLEEVRARLKFKPRPSITSSVRSRDKWFIKQRAEYGPPE